MEIQKTVAHNLIQARGELSRSELAKRAGVTYQHIYEIEETDKNPSLKVLSKLADALNIEVYRLLKDDNGKPPVREAPVSKTLQKMMAVPDEVYECACELDKNDKVWGDVLVTLKRRVKSLKEFNDKVSNN